MAHHPQQQGFQRFSLKAFLRFKDFLCEKVAQTVTFYHYKNRQICSFIQLTDTPSSFSFQQ
jgi:hypothetical protein